MLIAKDTIQYKFPKINIRFIIKHDFDIVMSDAEWAELAVAQEDSLFLEQLRRVTNKDITETRLDELIIVEAKKNKKTADATRKILSDGFNFNGRHYVRYGKSSSQGKDGITLFIWDEVYHEMFLISQLEISVEKCVISKYESQRNLTLSTCAIVKDKLPHIVIVDEYTKIIHNQKIRYVVESKKEIIDKKTGLPKIINTREVEEGFRDVKISPFDGCGCHTKEMSELWSSTVKLDYHAIGFQIRLPFMKGYSVEFDFKEYYKTIGVDYIVDIFGTKHNVSEIDCIWNTSMWKGCGIFKDKFGDSAFNEYINVLNKYGYSIGISKYSHHIKNLNLKTRMNFQYLQCLNLWNEKYIEWFTQKERPKYDILDPANRGKMLSLATYTTNLYEKIIKGEKFYSLKFLGMDDSEICLANSDYLNAVIINDVMLKDVAVKQYLYRKLKKSIDQAKYGKIYADGFYHTCVGDMIGYLEYCAGRTPVGCLDAKQFYCKTIPKGKILSFRSPLVCPSEVNDVEIVENKVTKKWFSHFQDQDVVMLNMYDLSMPQQGGMDADGDAIFLCNDPLLLDTKIHKSTTIDIDDKISAVKKQYTKDNIIEYEMNSRDNRIGEITNIATSIINQYVKDEKWRKINADNISLLRVYQGKEIDYQKTGVRWQMNKWMRNCGKKIPFFLLFRYPDRLKKYYAIQSKNKKAEIDVDKVETNAYHSPSPLNELCDYILTWEKHKIQWDRTCVDTSCLIVNQKLKLDDPTIIKKIKHLLNELTVKWMELCKEDDDEHSLHCDELFTYYRKLLKDVVSNDTILANYCIKIAYSNLSSNKSIVWHLFGDVIISNLKSNTPQGKQTRIVETTPYNSNAYEYLGKYYEMVEGVSDV